MITLDEYIVRNADRIAADAGTSLSDTELAILAGLEYDEAKEHCAVVVDAWRYRVANQRLGNSQAAEVMKRWLETNGSKTQEQAVRLNVDIVERVVSR